MSDLKVGDVVCSKAGGPLMTVIRCFTGAFLGKSEHNVECMWFDADYNLHKGIFPVASIKVGG